MAKVIYADDFRPSFGIPWRPVLTREHVKDWDNERLAHYLKVRKEVEAGAINNPVGQGWSLPMWDLVQENWHKYKNIIILGGNRSSKSVFASRLSLWAGATIPEAEVRLYHVNEDRSIQDQQAMVYDALPIGIKSLPTKKGMHHSLQFSQKNGFTDNICILPPLPGYRKGSQMIFGNYRQYQQDAQVIEGYKAHLVWCDEECPQKMFETLQYRTVDYHGRIILTFTTITGWTPLIQDILGKTKTIKTRFAPLLGRELPIMQESLSRPGTVIYYFWTEHNAFIDTLDFLDKIKTRSKDEILARAYGIPTKSVTSVFPGFNKEINVIPHEKLPWLAPNLKKDKKGDLVPYKITRYMAIDPAGSKAWFMAWVAIDALGTWWVYREHPDNDDWALPGNTVEGKPGPAQKGQKLGIKGYVELINGIEKEDGAEVFERYIDPRMGAAERQSEDGATTIISDLDDAGMTVIPAPGVDIENGIQLLNNLFAWDETKPRDSLNSPKIYISDRCQNIIYALSEYTAQGGNKEATKDCVDVLRYLAVSDVQFIDSKQFSEALTHGRTGSY
jgi:hypothetical protein